MFKTISVILLSLLVTAVQAGENSEDRSELIKRLQPLQSLSAEFTQTVSGADGYELQALKGNMAVARPGKVFWQSTEPYPQLVISDSKTLWLYDPDLEQVTIRPFLKDISHTPAILFIGEVDQLESLYQVRTENQAVGKGSRIIYWLTPVDEQSLYQKISIEFDGELPVALSLSDSLGQTTRIEFDNVQINATVDDSLFSFIVPDGIDVLYDD